MNVLFVVPWDNIGGVSHVVNRVAEHLRAQGHGVYFLLPGNQETPTEDVSLAGFPAFRLNLRVPVIPGRQTRSRTAFTLMFPLTLMRLSGLLRRLRIDVVNVHFPGGSGVYFAALRRLGLVRLVTSIHGADLLPNGARPSTMLPGISALLEASDALVSPSDSYRNAVREAWPELTRPMRTIPNGIDPDELGYVAGTPDTTEEPPFVFSILQMVHYKGVDILIRAFAALCADYPSLTLQLASDGPQREDYERLAASLGVADRIRFLGFLQRPAVSAKLRACTLFVLPSRTNSESFGIAAAEAMAVDRATIASRIGGLPELIEDGVSGLLVPPGDVEALSAAMRRVLDDPTVRERFGRAGGERIRRQFLWARTGALYEQLFTDLASNVTASARGPRPLGRRPLEATDDTPFSTSLDRSHGTLGHSAPLSHAGTSQEGW